MQGHGAHIPRPGLPDTMGPATLEIHIAFQAALFARGLLDTAYFGGDLFLLQKLHLRILSADISLCIQKHEVEIYLYFPAQVYNMSRH